MGENKIVLPPGFEFDPSDEELIIYFLCRRTAGLPCYPNIIPDLDLYQAYPWDLNDKAFWSKKECYFFSRLNGCRKKGLWKEVGVSEAIFRGNNNGDEEIGTKKYLVFYGEDDEGGCSDRSSNWIMEEYHLLSNHPTSQVQDMSEWVLCRVREAKVDIDSDEEKQINGGDGGVELSYLDEVFLSMEDDDDQEEINFPT